MRGVVGFVEDNFILWEDYMRFFPRGDAPKILEHYLTQWYSYPDMYASYLEKRVGRVLSSPPPLELERSESTVTAWDIR